MRTRVPILSACLGLALAACGGTSSGDDAGAPDGGAPDAGTTPHPVLKNASKSGTIAITDDTKHVVMVNPEVGTISVFDTATSARTAQVPTGNEPSAVVLGPDNHTAYVANRADATVVKVTNLDAATPDVSDPLAVGSEPTGLALSPSGATLYVAEWAEGRISVIDTSTMTETASIDAPDHPRGVAVTNNGDQNDDDELIIVPEFFGTPTGVEGTDTSRTGKVRVYAAGDLSPQAAITFAPHATGFFPLGATDTTPVVASANQLWTAAVIGQKVYVPTISASPAPPVNFRTNVQPIVYVGDLGTHAEDTSATGTMDLASLVSAQIPDTQTRFFLADIVDLAFVGDKVMYVVSRGADVLQRVALDSGAPVLGSSFNKQIDLNKVPSGSTQPCQNPTGVAIGAGLNKAFVNCWGTRQLGIVDLSNQALAATVQSAGIDVSEADQQAGRHFYFTARGRWSKDSWSDCGSCHPDGLTDDITWVFAAGPRQTLSMDGTFSHFPGDPQKQRVLNATAIFDEIHDFEGNTRGVSGGVGAITTAPSGGTCGDPTTEVPTALPGGLAAPVRPLQSCNHDWDQIEAFSKTIRPPRALQKLDPASVARGRTLFGEDSGNGAACVRCHGGPGWTASRVYATPQLPADAFTQPAAWPGAAAGVFQWNFHTLHVAPQPATTVFGTTAPEASPIAPPEVACVLRNVGTFGPDELEVKNFAVNGTPGARAEGRLGYNIPSLYGLALGAPYLHSGAASSLQDLFDNSAFATHATAGNPNWLQGDAATVAQRKTDLISFLLSIDANEPEQSIPGPPTGPWDGCP